MDKFFESFSSYVPLSNALKKELSSRMEPHSFAKGQIVHSADRICTRSFFVQEGILRLYFLKGGQEITEFFGNTGEWVNSPRSFMKQVEDIYYVDAIEDTETLSLHVKDLMFLFDNFPEMERYARLSMGSTFAHLMERLTSIRFTTAREKYDHFLNTYGDIYHRLPLGMVASYIGIAQETLSRLRHEK